MKKAIYGIVGLIVLLIVAVIALPFLIPAERLKEELILAVSDATGRTLSIDGDFGVSVFPTLGLNASKVSFSNAPDSSEPNMATIGTLTVELSLLPLLSGQVKVDKFVLDSPVINLESNKNGKKNWEFETATKPEADKTESGTGEQSSGGSDLGIRDLNLGDVQVISGTFTYSDLKSGERYDVTDLNLALVLTGLEAPFEAKGSAVWNKETIEFDTQLGMLKAVLENKATTLNASVSSSKVTFTLDGDLGATQPLTLNGKTDLNIPSLKDLTAWVGQPMKARENTFGTVSVKGDVGIKGQVYTFKNAELAFDAINGTGDFLVNLGQKVPYIEGKLTIAELDVNPYLSEGAQQDTAASGNSAPASSSSSSGQAWDDTPIDFSGLKTANAKFDLTIGKILIQKIKIGQSSVATTLKNSVLDLALTELALYDGKGKGAVSVDARSAAAKISKSFKMEGIQLKPLLTDAADFKKLEGTGLIDIKVSTAGQSQKDFVEALNGNGNILFENGAISGINLAAMARNVATAFTDSGEAQKTDFAELSGTFKIVNGLLTNDDLKMLNPFVRLSGKGNVNIPPKTLDYRVEPKLVATTEGQGGKQASGIVVPIKVSGTWDNPKFAPDLAGVISNVADPEKLKENIKEKGKEELGKVLKEGLGGLFGKKK